jgi:hypothetical protein
MKRGIVYMKKIRTKKLNEIKAGVVTIFVLSGLLGMLMPISSAGPIFNFQSILNVSWGNETQQPFVPRGEIRTVRIVITHTVTKTAGGKGVLSTLKGALIPIHVEIVEKPSWCSATVQQGTLSVTVQPDITSTVETTIAIQVTNNAPANSLGYIKVKATADRTSIIEGFENVFTLSFIPAYKSLINPSLPETNMKEIGPMDTAVLPITISNLGNARTIVFLDVTSIPEDWVAVVTSQLTLEEGAGSYGTAYLIVKPPKSFGYHNDEQTIKVSMQPVDAGDYSKRGEITYQTFLVQSRGFSTPGFETIVFLGAFALTLLIIVYIRKRKK